MVDFKKMMDPEYMREVRAKIAAGEAARAAHDDKIGAAIESLTSHSTYDLLSEKEQSFLISCRGKVGTFGILSEKQEKWLFDIAARFAPTAPADSPQQPKDWQMELDALGAWQWDGHSVDDIVERLETINMHFPNKDRDWAHTVPAQFQGKIVYVASRDPMNSESETREQFEILAVDGSEKALICKTQYRTYEGVEDSAYAVMPLDDAQAVRATYAQRKAQDEITMQQELESPADSDNDRSGYSG